MRSEIQPSVHVNRLDHELPTTCQHRVEARAYDLEGTCHADLCRSHKTKVHSLVSPYNLYATSTSPTFTAQRAGLVAIARSPYRCQPGFLPSPRRLQSPRSGPALRTSCSISLACLTSGRANTSQSLHLPTDLSTEWPCDSARILEGASAQESTQTLNKNRRHAHSTPTGTRL